MHIVVTGANGFIGHHLITKILENPESLTGGKALTRLTLIDLDFDVEQKAGLEQSCVRKIKGSFAEESILDAAFSELPADLVFHLASVPSGMAESNYSLGVEVNIHGTQRLLNALKEQGNAPTVVFASSIAIFGKPCTDQVNEDTRPTPNLSYGAQKVIGETLMVDYCRRQWIKGCSIRIPGIVTRPPVPNGAVSIFFSDLIRNLSAGEKFICPVSSQAKSWLMSIDRVVQNLIVAASLESSQSATWTLPALHISIEELVEAIATLHPQLAVKDLIQYQPDSWVEDNFGSYPPLLCPRAEAAGFKHDGNLESLIKSSLS